MKTLRIALLIFFWIGISNADSKPPPIKLLLCVSQSEPDSANLRVQSIIINTSTVVQDLSKAGKISLTCKIGTPTTYVPGQYIGLTRWLEPEIAALKLRPGKWVSQTLLVRHKLGAREIAEISVSCEIDGIDYKSNTIYLSKREGVAER